MPEGGYSNVPAKPADRTTASIGGTPRTSPADDLRALLADRATSAMSVWIYDHGPNVLALLDAAQALPEGDGVEGVSIFVKEPLLKTLAEATRALSEPRP